MRTVTALPTMGPIWMEITSSSWSARTTPSQGSPSPVAYSQWLAPCSLGECARPSSPAWWPAPTWWAAQSVSILMATDRRYMLLFFFYISIPSWAIKDRATRCRLSECSTASTGSSHSVASLLTCFPSLAFLKILRRAYNRNSEWGHHKKYMFNL